MAEPTLSLAYNDLAGEVGTFLGWGRGTALGDPAWSSQQQAPVDSCVRSGLRQWYYPHPIEVMDVSYDWAFLKPMVTLSLVANQTTLPLPDDYGGVEGRVTLSAPQGIQWWPLEFLGIGQVYQQQALFPTTTGRPWMCCTEPLKGTTGTQGQRSQLRVWPIPDMAYTLQLQYYVNPDYLTGANPYAYGGAQHVETILESCLAIAEQRLDDAMGVHTLKFKERLIASINMDRKSKPQTLGYNGDRSDLRDRRWGPRYDRIWGQNLITGNGMQYYPGGQFHEALESTPGLQGRRGQDRVEVRVREAGSGHPGREYAEGVRQGEGGESPAEARQDAQEEGLGRPCRTKPSRSLAPTR